jgi:hypothetical protein
MQISRHHQAMFAALVLAAASTGCGDQAPMQSDQDAAVIQPARDLASTAVSILEANRSGPFHVVIPDETRTENRAIVLHIRDGLTTPHVFVRDARGWTIAETLPSTRRNEEPRPATGPLLARGTYSTDPPYGTPMLANVTMAYPDGTWSQIVELYPVEYTSSGTYRWRQSAEVVSGIQDAVKDINSSQFVRATATRWSVGDSVFTVDAYNKWTFGDYRGVLKECSLANIDPTTPCSSYGVSFSQRPAWTDAYYHITITRSTAGSISVSPTSVRGKPGESAQLTATVKNQYDEVMSAPVTWTSSNTGVATVSSTGLVTFHGLGDAWIRAVSGAVSDGAWAYGRPVVTLTGPSTAVDAWATATSAVSPAGSYYYKWTYDRCDYRQGFWECIWNQPLAEGQNLTSQRMYVSKYDDFARFRVRIMYTSTGAELARAELKVNGGGQVFNGGSTCPIGTKVC